MTTTTQQIGWLSRPDGGRFFTPGKVHDYDASIDLDEVGSLRTECGTEVPKPVLRELRGTRSGRGRTEPRSAIMMDQAEMANAQPCKRCAKKAGR